VALVGVMALVLCSSASGG